MNRLILKIVFIGIVLALFSSCEDRVIQGRISVRGSEPNTMLTIQTSQGVFEITGPLKQEIWKNYQGQEIKIRCTLLREAKGPGMPAQIEALEIL